MIPKDEKKLHVMVTGTPEGSDRFYEMFKKIEKSTYTEKKVPSFHIGFNAVAGMSLVYRFVLFSKKTQIKISNALDEIKNSQEAFLKLSKIGIDAKVAGDSLRKACIKMNEKYHKNYKLQNKEELYSRQQAKFWVNKPNRKLVKRLNKGGRNGSV